MTRIPTESWDVQAMTGDMYPKYRVKPLCSHPACSRFIDHTHHIVRRSFIGGDVAWVKFANGDTVGNLAGLCYRHHDEITVNKGHIAYEERLHQFTWVDEDGISMGKLDPHPPRMFVGLTEEKDEHVHLVGPGSTPVCTECHRPLPRPKEKGEKREEAKRRKTWTVRVPDTSDEDGAVVLDTLLEECATIFGRDMSQSNIRYYVLAQALALVVQNSHLLG